jgi:adenylate cyclase
VVLASGRVVGVRLFRTVKSKLTTLVGLSALVTLVAIPVLHVLMTTQLEHVVEERLPAALRGFELEIEDDLHDVQAVVGSLERSTALTRAVAEERLADIADELRPFADAYPTMTLGVFADERGRALAGVRLPPAELQSELLAGALAAGDSAAPHPVPGGCSATEAGGTGLVHAHRAHQSGAIVLACVPVDAAYLGKVSGKLGVELALLDPQRGEARVSTPAFPRELISAWRSGDDPLIEHGSKSWALAKHETAFAGAESVEVMVALDMTGIESILRRNGLLSVLILAVVAIFAMAAGARLAHVMASALGRLNVALRKLEQSEYAHVVGVKTGDEIEDLATGFNSMVDGLRERDKLRTTFGKYMTPSIVEHLLKGDVKLGGETLTVTILFTDIRGFTSISESMTAHELVALLNEYFTEMVGIVTDEGGVVDKYIGDAIMAVFGAPVSAPDDAARAVRAAVRMREALAHLNERLVARGAKPIDTGIGLHTGEVVAGNIGSEARMEYTVIGDAVNVASRLEGCTKELGAEVLISDATARLLGDGFTTRSVGELTVKGRAQPITVHAVLGTATRKSA